MDTSESSILQSSSENQLDQMKTLQKSFFEMNLLGWEENKTSSLMTEILFSNFSKAQEIKWEDLGGNADKSDNN